MKSVSAHTGPTVTSFFFCYPGRQNPHA